MGAQVSKMVVAASYTARHTVVRTAQQKRGMALAVATGRGGRSSVSGVQATVFGATGRLGRPVVNKLGRMGSQVVVPYRGDEHDTRHLKVMGDYGQIVMVPFQLKDTESISHVVQHGNVLINAMGQSGPSFNYTLQEANVDGVRAIAEAARSAGIERFIHVSALTSPHSTSDFAKTKAEGEAAVKDIYPDATILRPGSMYGPEDNFLSSIAGQATRPMAVVPLLDGGQAKRQPIFYDDVAEAIMICLRDPNTVGKTYELGGPTVYTMEELYHEVFSAVGAQPWTPPLPSRMGFAAGYSKDYAQRAVEDEVVSEGALTIADLGIQPMALKDKVDKLLLRFKPQEISAKDAGVLL